MKEVSLSTACDVNPLKRGHSILPDDTEVLFVPMSAVDEVTGAVTAAEVRTLGELKSKSYRHFESGDVIFAKITPCMENGKSAIVPEVSSRIGFGSTEFHVLRPKPGVDARYIWHFVRQAGLRRRAKDAMTGSVGQARVPAEFIENYAIPLPDERTQAAIADVLDLALDRGRSASVHLAAAKRASERFRQSVLAAACSGRLTSAWREGHSKSESAHSLIQTVVAERKTRLGKKFKSVDPPTTEEELPAGWAWAAVGSLIDVATGATPLRGRSDYYGGSVPWVTSGAVNAGLIVQAKEHITETALRETNAKVFPAGTLLVAMYGEGQTRGRVAELGIAAATNQAVAALLFDESNDFLRDYVRLFFLKNYEQIRQMSFGGVQPNLSLGVIKETLIPLPPRDEQVEICRQVRTLMEASATILGRVSTASSRVDMSAQAVLAKAFRGDLNTAQVLADSAVDA